MCEPLKHSTAKELEPLIKRRNMKHCVGVYACILVLGTLFNPHVLARMFFNQLNYVSVVFGKDIALLPVRFL